MLRLSQPGVPQEHSTTRPLAQGAIESEQAPTDVYLCDTEHLSAMYCILDTCKTSEVTCCVLCLQWDWARDQEGCPEDNTQLPEAKKLLLNNVRAT